MTSPPPGVMFCRPCTQAAAQGLPTLADKSCTGAGINIKTPIKGAKPCPDNVAYNTIQAGLHTPDERTNALLKGFKAHKESQPGPSAITTIASAALIILNLNNQPR